MPEGLMLWVLIALFAVLIPAALLFTELRRQGRPSTTLVVPALSVVCMLVMLNHEARVMILGPDYSRSLYVAIEVAFFVTLISAIFALVRKFWFAATASVLVALAWLYLGLMNVLV